MAQGRGFPFPVPGILPAGELFVQQDEYACRSADSLL